MKPIKWEVRLGFLLVGLSALLYLLHFAIFKDFHHIAIYLLGDIAFLPVEVLLVTIIIHRLLTRREKRQLLEKLNMVIGAFFSEVGSDLMKHLFTYDRGFKSLCNKLLITQEWAPRDFLKAEKSLNDYPYAIDSHAGDLVRLADFLSQKRVFLVQLLENPALLEHQKFTDLLWAVFHLSEELTRREDFKKLPETDHEHLAGDIKRAYGLLLVEWLDYMRHLQRRYPYLYSLSVRTNPFDSHAQAIVR